MFENRVQRDQLKKNETAGGMWDIWGKEEVLAVFGQGSLRERGH